MKKIELTGVNKTFKQEQVLKDVNLKLEDHKIYGFIGRNGSGKSVLFKIICGYVLADSGEILIDGKRLGRDMDFPENLGALIETPGFIWYQSAFENLKYLARIRNRITDDQVKDAIRAVGLDPDSKKWTGKYSLGMKQRLGIAQAIMEQPELLILDEPMNGLDEQGVEEIRRLLLAYKGEERCILLTSHNKEDIESLCDQVFMIRNGQLTDVLL